MRLFGYNVVISEHCAGKPRMQLCEYLTDCMPPEFTAAHNEWALQFFGREPDKIYVLNDQDIVMSQQSFNQIQADKKP